MGVRQRSVPHPRTLAREAPRANPYRSSLAAKHRRNDLLAWRFRGSLYRRQQTYFIKTREYDMSGHLSQGIDRDLAE